MKFDKKLKYRGVCGKIHVLFNFIKFLYVAYR